MLMVKVHNKKDYRTNIFEKTIKNITSYISNNLNFKKVKIASDSDCIEIVSGNTSHENNDDNIVVELLIKKLIVINKDDLNDIKKCDNLITEVKHFCEQAKEIEDIKYIPLHYRDKDS